MRIQHNIMAMSVYRSYKSSISDMKNDMERLSSGYRINRAADDAASLAISEKMRAQITGLETAQKNAKDGVSLVQTAEGALQEMHDMLNRMVELATQSANGTYENYLDRYQLQKEMEQLCAELDRIANSTNFNNIKLLDGSLDGEFILGFKPHVTKANLNVGGDLPNVGSVQGQDTVLHSEATEYYNTEMNVDLSGITWDTSDRDKTLKIEVGDVTFTLTADSDKGTISGNDLTNAIMGGVTGIDVKITDSEGNVTDITGGSGGNSFALKLDGQDVIMSASGGKLHFELTGTPTNSSQALNAAKTVKVNGVESAAATAEYSFDLLGDVLGRGFYIFANTELTIGDYKYTVRADADAGTVAAAIAEEIKGGSLTVEGFDVSVDGTTVTLTAKEPGLVSDSAIPKIEVSRVAELIVPATTTNPGAPFTGAKYKLSFSLDDNEYLSVGDRKLSTLSEMQLFLRNDANWGSNWDLTVEQDSATGVFTISMTAKFPGDYAGIKGNKEHMADILSYVQGLSGIGNSNGSGEREIEDIEWVENGTDGSVAEYYFDLPASWVEGTDILIDDVSYSITDKNTSQDTQEIVVNGKKYEVAYDGKGRITLKRAEDPDGYEVDEAPLIVYRKSEPDSRTIKGDPGKDADRIDKTFSSTGGASESTGEDRRASTKFRLTRDFVAAGAKVTIGTKVYEFISNSSQQGLNSDHGTTYVDVSSRNLAQIAQNLADAAKGNDVWSVSCDGNWITLIEADRHANLAGNTNLDDYKKGSGSDFDLSTVQGINDSLDYEGILIDGTENLGKGLILQIGDTSDDFNKLYIYIKDCRTAAMMYTDDEGNEYSIADISVANQIDAVTAIDVVRNAINYISDVRGKLGAYQNRLEHTQNNLSVMTENIQDAESTIRDTDIAELMMEYTKHSIMIQSSQAMLAQANQIPQGVLQLML